MNSLPKFTDASLDLMVDLIQQKTGLDYNEHKRSLLVDKLTPLILEHEFDNLLDYMYFLQYGDEAEAEWLQIQAALAVNETYFWREYQAVKVTAAHIVPSLQKAAPDLPVRIWHAACATGEEPYSMAISLLEAGCYQNGPIEIIATDMNTTALALARNGVYRSRSLQYVPLEIQEKYFQEVGNGDFRLADSIRSLVQFNRVNLVNENDIRSVLSCDIIFCRNVFIYFSAQAIQAVANSFYQALHTPGFLFLGAAESLFRVKTHFELNEIYGSFCYLKLPKHHTNSSYLLGDYRSLDAR